MDTLQGMRVFAAVAEAGSFSQAADRLGLSRAMASKHVQQLEQHLGVRLLQRTTRKLRLTESGSTYFERCRQILAAVGDLEPGPDFRGPDFRIGGHLEDEGEEERPLRRRH